MESDKLHKPRPSALYGPTVKSRLGCGNAYGTINGDAMLRPVEVFVQIGKSGQCPRVHMNGTCRAISHALRLGVDPEIFMKDFLGETCDRWDGAKYRPRSCADFLGRLIGYALGYYYIDAETGELTAKEVKQMDEEREQIKQMLDYIGARQSAGLLLEDDDAEFISVISSQLSRSRPLSDKQLEWLQDIFYKAKAAVE
jgi:hypothetical protein